MPNERTRNQVENVREAGLLNSLPTAALHTELRAMAYENNAVELLRLLEADHLLDHFSPALTGAKSNLAGLGKLQKAKQLVPFGLMPTDHPAIFLFVLTEKMNAKEKAVLAKNCGLSRGEVDRWQKLDQRSKPLDKALQSAKLTKPSQVYAAVQSAPGEQVLYLLLYSSHRLVQDRLKNYLQKYATMAADVTDLEVEEATKLAPGSPKFAKAKVIYIAKKLDARPKKVVVPEEVPLPVSTMGRPGGRPPGRPPGRPRQI